MGLRCASSAGSPFSEYASSMTHHAHPPPDPQLSVVVSVYNGEDRLEASLRSVLDQQGPSFEVILLNDGSGPKATSILRALAAEDSRIRLLEQSNTGLTRALIRACAEARAPIIVRHDADDMSLPGRFQLIDRAFRQHPDAVLVATWSEMRGPRDEPLYVVTRPRDPSAWRLGLLHNRLGPPAHGATAFRRAAYEQVGGYRAGFYYAQDSDLWLRLAVIGSVVCVPEVGYVHVVSADSISGAASAQQRAFGELGQACHRARMAGEDDRDLLARAASIRSMSTSKVRSHRAQALYFIGACLANRQDRRCMRYLWSAWLHAPWRVKYLARAALGLATLVRQPLPTPTEGDPSIED